jgi:hypothetical protein
MVDTFYRAGYTSDTNAAMLLLLREFAAAEEVAGDAERAAVLRSQVCRACVILPNRCCVTKSSMSKL